VHVLDSLVCENFGGFPSTVPNVPQLSHTPDLTRVSISFHQGRDPCPLSLQCQRQGSPLGHVQSAILYGGSHLCSLCEACTSTWYHVASAQGWLLKPLVMIGCGRRRGHSASPSQSCQGKRWPRTGGPVLVRPNQRVSDEQDCGLRLFVEPQAHGQRLRARATSQDPRSSRWRRVNNMPQSCRLLAIVSRLELFMFQLEQVGTVRLLPFSVCLTRKHVERLQHLQRGLQQSVVLVKRSSAHNNRLPLRCANSCVPAQPNVVHCASALQFASWAAKFAKSSCIKTVWMD
jgi:hypothetical protein